MMPASRILLFLGALGAMSLGTHGAEKPALDLSKGVLLRVERARRYLRRGQEHVARAEAAKASKLLSESSKKILYRRHLSRAAASMRLGWALLRDKKDKLSIDASAEITRALVGVLSAQARMYIEQKSLSRAEKLVKKILKLSPGDATAQQLARKIEEEKRKDVYSGSGYYSAGRLAGVRRGTGAARRTGGARRR